MSEQFHFFLKGHLSQWSKSPFIDGCGIQYKCAEQYMMYQKARLFGDTESMNKILIEKSPSKQKALGRAVKNYDQKIWDIYKWDIVKTGNYLKFTQNPKHKESLLATKGTLVECNASDQVWGIGLSEHDPRINERSEWRGMNLLGKILTELREQLREKYEV